MILRQDIVGHLRSLWGMFGANGLFADTFLFEGRGYIPLDAYMSISPGLMYKFYCIIPKRSRTNMSPGLAVKKLGIINKS